MAENFTCPQCGAPLPEGAPPGPCADCLWDIGLPEKQIGPYRIFEQIGEGGYGVVYRAEREQPYWQTVALKVVKAGMDTREVLARFEAERQALALMDHPAISRKCSTRGATMKGRALLRDGICHGPPDHPILRPAEVGDSRAAQAD